MDAAKASVKKVLGRSGHHDTSIHENVSPAIQHETVAQKQHEQHTAAIDREVHQDHYHTSEQPIHHSEVLPEQHHHRELDVEHKSYEHGNADHVKQRLEQERAGYQGSTTHVEGEKTRSTEPTVTGEHVHHHVYENIQPVVHKQTVEPHVVHTTVPVHETHHNEAKHHSASALPAISMDDFKKQGGALGGREERKDFFPGEPKSFGTSSGVTMDGHGSNPKSPPLHSNDVNVHTGGHASSANPMSSSGNSSTPIANQMSSGNHSSSEYRPSGSGSNPIDNPTTNTKPSLMDKINPKKDATGDGVAGFMK